MASEDNDSETPTAMSDFSDVDVSNDTSNLTDAADIPRTMTKRTKRIATGKLGRNQATKQSKQLKSKTLRREKGQEHQEAESEQQI